MKIMQSPDKTKKGKNPNDPSRFIQKTAVTDDGEIAKKQVYRLLEKKLEEGFTCSEILKTLREMNVTLLSKDSGYIPSYKRTKLTDALHNTFDFRTDYEFISKADMRTIIKKQSKKNSTNSKIAHIDAKKKTATSLINTGVMAVFCSIKCQRWNYSRFFPLCKHL